MHRPLPRAPLFRLSSQGWVLLGPWASRAVFPRLGAPRAVVQLPAYLPEGLAVPKHGLGPVICWEEQLDGNAIERDVAR